jgi:hypothetical protein
MDTNRHWRKRFSIGDLTETSALVLAVNVTQATVYFRICYAGSDISL